MITLATAKPDIGIPVWTGEKRPPTGLGYLKVVLERAGHKVDLIDRYVGDERSPVGDALGVYCCSWCRKDAHALLTSTKIPFTMAGGPDVWAKNPPADMVCKGEGEKIILDMKPGIWEPPRLTSYELDQLPRFPYAWFYHPKRRGRYNWHMPFSKVRPIFTMNTSRGCPFFCAFCETPNIWGKKWTSFSPERILDDIAYIKTLGAKGIYFREDNFTVSKKRIEAISKGMIDKNLVMPWACECRVDSVNKELLSLMKRSGLEGVYVGVESLSEKILKTYNKGVTPDQIERFFGWCNDIGIKVLASFIKNGPGETPEDAQESKDFIERWRPWKVVKNQYRKKTIGGEASR